MKIFAIAVCVFILTGCASLTGISRGAKWPWPAGNSLCADGACQDKDVLDAYLQAHIFCRSVHNYYESGGSRAGKTQIAIGAIGSLAGSVISPIANGSAAKAWAGLSGTTNALQTSVKENFSGSIAAKRTKAVADATINGETAFALAPDAKTKVIAAINMATACSMAPAKADNEAIKALAGP